MQSFKFGSAEETVAGRVPQEERMIEKPCDLAELAGCLMVKDVTRISKVYAKPVHIIDAQNKWNISGYHVEGYLSSEVSDWDSESNYSFGLSASKGEVTGGSLLGLICGLGSRESLALR